MALLRRRTALTKAKQQLMLNYLYQSLDSMLLLTKKIPRSQCPEKVQAAMMALLQAIIELEPEENLKNVIQFPNKKNLRKKH
jgi:hypothetical protein